LIFPALGSEGHISEGTAVRSQSGPGPWPSGQESLQ
jgi:hypothetical protein